MTEKELSVLGQIAFLARTDGNLHKLSQDEFAKWISRQLAESLGVFTHPVGASYFTLCTKEQYEDYVRSA